MSNVIIRIGNPNGTYLKSTNLQSTDISNKNKIYVPVNTDIALTDITKIDDRNHCRISLVTPEQNNYSWYLYAPHFVILTSDDTDYLANTPNVINNVISVEPKIAVSKYPPFVQKQLISLSKYSPTGKINLDTSCVYFSQRDNYTMQHRTCNSSANAMYLNWLQRASGQANVLTNDDEYLKVVLKHGDTIYHEAQTYAIKQYGFNTMWNTSGDYSKLKEAVLAGFVVPINILHRGTRDNPRGGHIVCVIGYRQSDDWILMDPYGEFESNYTNHNGRHTFFSGKDMKIRWQKGARYLA